jgi:hypothetical protein
MKNNPQIKYVSVTKNALQKLVGNLAPDGLTKREISVKLQ